jgi:hypothetical protein
MGIGCRRSASATRQPEQHGFAEAVQTREWQRPRMAESMSKRLRLLAFDQRILRKPKAFLPDGALFTGNLCKP